MEDDQAEGPRPLRVLVVEDEAEQRSLCVALLKGLGCRVEVAVDGGAAVSQANAFHPDIVLMDLSLPMIDGRCAIYQIRQTGSRRPHIVAITGFDEPHRRRAAFEAGCDDYLVKPIAVHLPDVIKRYSAAKQTRNSGRTESR